MSDAELDDLLAQVRALAGEGSPVAGQTESAVNRYRQPLTIQVAGRAGAGKSAAVLALGLSEQAEQPAMEQDSAPPDGDIVLYVLPGQPNEIDSKILAALPPERRLAILNTRETPHSAAAALAAAAAAAQSLATETVPVACWLAAQIRHGGVNEAELRHFQALAATADPLLTMSPDLFVAAPGPVDSGARSALQGRWDFTGVCTILAALQAEPTLTSARIDQILTSTSGLVQLWNAVAGRAAQIEALRGGKLLTELAGIAARSGGPLRDCLEQFQNSQAAIELNVQAGLAEPALARYSRAVVPEDGAELLQYWSAAAGDRELSATARRAALRVHHAISVRLDQTERAHA